MIKYTLAVLIALITLTSATLDATAQRASDCAHLPKKPAKNFSVSMYTRAHGKAETIIRIEQSYGQYVVLTGTIGNVLRKTGDTILSGVPVRVSDVDQLYEMVRQDSGFCEHPADFVATEAIKSEDPERYIVIRAGKAERTIEIKDGRGLWATNLVQLLNSFAARGN